MLMPQKEIIYFYVRLSSPTMKGLSGFCSTKKFTSPGTNFLELDPLWHGTNISYKIQQCKLEWQARWLLDSAIKHQVLSLTRNVTFPKEAELWHNCKPNLSFLSVKKQAETRSKQETSSTGSVKSYYSIITVTKATHSIEVDSHIR